MSIEAGLAITKLENLVKDLSSSFDFNTEFIDSYQEIMNKDKEALIKSIGDQYLDYLVIITAEENIKNKSDSIEEHLQKLSEESLVITQELTLKYNKVFQETAMKDVTLEGNSSDEDSLIVAQQVLFIKLASYNIFKRVSFEIYQLRNELLGEKLELLHNHLNRIYLAILKNNYGNFVLLKLLFKKHLDKEPHLFDDTLTKYFNDLINKGSDNNKPNYHIQTPLAIAQIVVSREYYSSIDNPKINNSHGSGCLIYASCLIPLIYYLL